MNVDVEIYVFDASLWFAVTTAFPPWTITQGRVFDLGEVKTSPFTTAR